MASIVLGWTTRRRRIVLVPGPWAVSLGLYEACILPVRIIPGYQCLPSAHPARGVLGVASSEPIGPGPVASRDMVAHESFYASKRGLGFRS